MIRALISLLLTMHMQIVAPIDRIEMARSNTRVSCRATGTFTLPTGTVLNDFLLIQGSSTKTVHWTTFEKECRIASSPTNWTNVLVRRTSETGGTPTTLTAIADDSNGDACTATVQHYGAAVTTGNSGGSVFLQRYVDRIPTNTAAFADLYRDSFGAAHGELRPGLSAFFNYGYQRHGPASNWRPMKPLVLRGTSDILAFTTSASFANVINCFVNFEWYEDNQ